MLRKIESIFYIILLIWILALIEHFIFNINKYGIISRSPEGVIGILISPLLHQNISIDYSHILNNTVMLSFLLPIIVFLYNKPFSIIGLIYIISGSMVWAFARGGVSHIGASGVIFGLISFILVSGLMSMKLFPIIASILLTFMYGIFIFGIIPTSLVDIMLILKCIINSIILGIDPSQVDISWEGHLYGILSGIIVFIIMFKNNSIK